MITKSSTRVEIEKELDLYQAGSFYVSYTETLVKKPDGDWYPHRDYESHHPVSSREVARVFRHIIDDPWHGSEAWVF